MLDSSSSGPLSAQALRPDLEAAQAPQPCSVTLDANEAVASVAYRLSEVIAIYPITPASSMGEHADAWAADSKQNLWGFVPDVVEMQSEGGAAGAVHGALQAGALTTTFTASQGLLLMLPNFYKIAGELTPFCVHVAARAIATHALSIFGDHSDVMSARSTGFAMLASGNAQEAQDLAAIAHAATLICRVPMMHFFDGFRTSHELSKVLPLDDDQLRRLVPEEYVRAHRLRALNPDRPVIRGTSQNPDVFFQGREAANPYYSACPRIVEDTMARFAELTGREYQLFDYVGHPLADRVIVMMGSGAEAAHETVEWLNDHGQRVGLIKVRLYRPFSVKALARALPATVKTLAVLDRCKEPGSVGEPLMLDVIAAVNEAANLGLLQGKVPRVIGGRYGLASKEVTPAMLEAVFDEAGAAAPRTHFTIGIHDDVSYLSLPYDESFDLEPADVVRAVFFGLGADGTVSSNKATIKIIGEETPLFAQGHFEYDSRKSGSTTVSHLRFGPRPIRSTYRVRSAQFVSIHDPRAVERDGVFELLSEGGTVLLNSPLPAEQIWDALPREAQELLVSRHARLFTIDGQGVAERAGLGRRINTVMQTCFFALSGVLPREEAIERIKHFAEKAWSKRGPKVVERNVAAIDTALAHLFEVPIPERATSTRSRGRELEAGAPELVRHVTRALLDGRGDQLPVSAMPADGTWPVGTSKYEKRAIALEIPIWDESLCVQCNRCVMVCPHTAIRAKVYGPSALEGAPAGFRSAPSTQLTDEAGLRYTLQVAPEDCTGCGLCVEICPAKDRQNPEHRAIDLEPLSVHKDEERVSFEFFGNIPDLPGSRLPPDPKRVGLRPAYFEFSGACTGCGEAPYIRLLTQLFGDRLMMANATGCSSIFGGNLPTTPYTTDAHGRGPAWANSLFEDNAEFGYGLRRGVDVLERRARVVLRSIAGSLPQRLVDGLFETPRHDDAWIEAQRRRISELRLLLHSIPGPESALLLELAGYLVPRSVWIVGGDGWAYDIGYGGLDHVLSTGNKVNVLVLDTEVYSNTGGQSSKATPIGAMAKFSAAGKGTRKKDLGLLAMSYGHVYVAEVALQTRSPHTLKAMLEAESYDGPSLIIAHSPCIAHGYELNQCFEHQKHAVDSGVWPLYRFDPRRIDQGESPLMLEPGTPTYDVAGYMAGEDRFKMVERRDPDRYQALVHAAEAAVRERRALYEHLAKLKLPH